MRKTKWYILIVALVIIESITLFLVYKSFNNKDASSINKETLFNKQQFAIQIGENGANYADYTGNGIPRGNYILNLETTECRDAKWNVISNKSILNYNGAKLTINLNGSIFCNLKFDKAYLGDQIIAVNPAGLENTYTAGLTRFVGVEWNQGIKGDEINNYICFGTSNIDTCLNNRSKYLYRIVGIAEDKSVKILKFDALMEGYKWDSRWGSEYYGGPISWVESDLYKALNGISTENIFIGSEFYNYLSTNNNGEESNWLKKIILYDWKYGAMDEYFGYNADDVYEIEEKQEVISAKVGLLYLYDYAYSYTTHFPIIGGNIEYSWIILGNSPYANYVDYEWTMHNYPGTYNGNRAVSFGYNYGQSDVNEFLAVRPVFFVDKNETLNGGTGSIDDPFLIVE